MNLTLLLDPRPAGAQHSLSWPSKEALDSQLRPLALFHTQTDRSWTHWKGAHRVGARGTAGGAFPHWTNSPSGEHGGEGEHSGTQALLLPSGWPDCMDAPPLQRPALNSPSLHAREMESELGLLGPAVSSPPGTPGKRGMPPACSV